MRTLAVLVATESDELRDRVCHVLQNRKEIQGAIPWFTIEIEQLDLGGESADAPRAMDALRIHLDARAVDAAIVISEKLVDPGPHETNGQLTSWGRDIHQTFSDCLIGTIGLVDQQDHPRMTRAVDVDRVIRFSDIESSALSAFALVAERLDYLQKPERKDLRETLVVREITRAVDLLEYYKIRHRVYRVMGYLKEDVEKLSSALEIDEFDTRSVHFGAFEDRRLVGTARIVLSEDGLAPDASATRDLIDRDSELRSSIPDLREAGRDYLLPIFYSQRKLMRERFPKVALGTICGELGRVIVRREYRGTGLSRVLVRNAIRYAANLGLRYLFLECLDMHCPVYEREGFKGIPGCVGRVLHVNRTMVGMELEEAEDRVIGVPAGDNLCACANRQCYEGDFLSYGTPSCPRTQN